MKTFIKENLFTSTGFLNSRTFTETWFLKNGFKKQYDLLKSIYVKNNCSNFAECVYLAFNNIARQTCKMCDNYTSFINFENGYREYCCVKCSKADPEHIQKGIDTFKKNDIEAITKKRKATSLKKYGVDNPSKAEEIKIKKIQSSIHKYGTENVFQAEEVKEKSKQTCMNKYGVDNIFKSQEFKNTIRKNTLSNYYNDVILKSQNFMPLFTAEDYIGVRNIHRFKCKKCGDIFEHNMYNGMSAVRCFKCYPQITGFSILEKEVVDYIKSLNVFIIENDREVISPLELDIYLPNNKLAIEFDGLYWHSSNNLMDDDKFKSKHLIKTQRCEQKNIQLLHIFENEWLDHNKQKIWKSIIHTKLGLNNKIAARKCEIVIPSTEEKKIFLNENHLQGDVNSSINIGLKHDDELIAVLNMSKSRFNKKYDYEILRFANKLNTNVIGGFSKLLSYFKRNYKGSIISYADIRYSNGNLYRQNNFEELLQSHPNYFYFEEKTHKLNSRLEFQKHKLKDLLEQFDNDLSEAENMYANGYRRIWDCGNKVFISK